jgi:uncharacterized protein YecA (UPF0149 family)
MNFLEDDCYHMGELPMFEQMTTIPVWELEKMQTEIKLLRAALEALEQLVIDSVNDEEAAQELMRVVTPKQTKPINSKNDSIFPGEL